MPQPGKKEAKNFKNESNIVFADSNYFKLINYGWVAGSPKTALLNPYQTVLTEDRATLYFPGLTAAQVIGKEIYINDTVRATITGIVKDLEKNSDFTFKTFIAYSTLENTSLKPENWDKWDNTNGVQQLFVKLSPGINSAQIEKQLASLYKKYYTPDADDHSITQYKLQPLSDIHFNSDYGSYDLPLANKPTLYSLLAVAAFLLLLGLH